jgi:hypothetical protein
MSMTFNMSSRAVTRCFMRADVNDLDRRMETRELGSETEKGFILLSPFSCLFLNSDEVHLLMMNVDPLPAFDGQNIEQTPKLTFMSGSVFGHRGYDEGTVVGVAMDSMASKFDAVANHGQSLLAA